MYICKKKIRSTINHINCNLSIFLKKKCTYATLCIETGMMFYFLHRSQFQREKVHKIPRFQFIRGGLYYYKSVIYISLKGVLVRPGFSNKFYIASSSLRAHKYGSTATPRFSHSFVHQMFSHMFLAGKNAATRLSLARHLQSFKKNMQKKFFTL